MTDGITIGQAASFAEVTIKTIRHYQQRGLIDEPSRDRSGYRRYGSADLLRLVQVRALAEAGVPLAEITDILDADPDQFAAALVDVEAQLTNRIDELIARRDTLRKLTSGDRVLLPERACAILDRLPGLGFADDFVTMARDGMILVRALVPEGFDDFLATIERSADDPVYISLIKRWSQVGDWPADDPRVDELATAWADHLIANPSLAPSLPGLQTRADSDTREELLSHHGEEGKPAWARMTELIKTRLRAAGIDV
jgi:DNA-binding transcriptional MerR regulator